MATAVRGARGTRGYSTPRGTNTSVRSNRMSAQQTPKSSKSVANTRTGRVGSGGASTNKAVGYGVRAGTFNNANMGLAGGAKTVSKTNGKTLARTSVYGFTTKTTTFKAPKSMPSKLNGTAAASVAQRRFGTSAAVAAVGLTPIVGAAVGGVLGARRAEIRTGNNFANVRLKAAGYRVAGTGFSGKVKPVRSKKSQARAQAKLKRIDNRYKVRTVKNGTRTFSGQKANAVFVTRNTNYARKVAAAKKGGGNRGRRTRRDSRGRYAGSY